MSETPNQMTVYASVSHPRLHRFTDKHRIPRWLARRLAQGLGYFWMPCRRCGRMYAGFEASGETWQTEDGRTWATCNLHRNGPVEYSGSR